MSSPTASLTNPDSVLPSLPPSGCVVPTKNDVLAGRGWESNEHQGNKEFLNAVFLRQEAYRRCYIRGQKEKLVLELVEEFLNNGWRFLGKKGGLWYELDKRRAVKLAQAKFRYDPAKKAEAKKKNKKNNSNNKSAADFIEVESLEAVDSMHSTEIPELSLLDAEVTDQPGPFNGNRSGAIHVTEIESKDDSISHNATFDRMYGTIPDFLDSEAIDWLCPFNPTSFDPDNPDQIVAPVNGKHAEDEFKEVPFETQLLNDRLLNEMFREMVSPVNDDNPAFTADSADELDDESFLAGLLNDKPLNEIIVASINNVDHEEGAYC